MSKQISTVMLPSDFEGNKHNPNDCIGYRSFKRAHTESLPWYKKWFMSFNYTWGAYSGNCNADLWFSSKDEIKVDMMEDVKVGDLVTFYKHG